MRNFAIASWTACLAVLAAGAWLLCPAGQCAAPQFDLLGLRLAQELRSPTLDALMAGATWLGSILVVWPLAAALAWRLARRGQRRAAAFLLLSLLGASALPQLVKLWVARPRPDLYPLWTALPGDWSYPSAHTMQATALAMALFLLAMRRRAALPLALAAVLGSAVALVGLSRIYLQVHFPSDVAAGLLAAALWVAGAYGWVFSRAAEASRDTASGETA